MRESFSNKSLILSSKLIRRARIHPLFFISRFYGFSSSYGVFAAASFMSFQQCKFNFGSEPFRFPPKKHSFKSFNDHATLEIEDKIVLPRHLFLEQLRKLSVREDSCTLCFDKRASIRIVPCNHRGFCTKCASQLQYCPMCRGDIVSTVHEAASVDTSPADKTSTTELNFT